MRKWDCWTLHSETAFGSQLSQHVVDGQHSYFFRLCPMVFDGQVKCYFHRDVYKRGAGLGDPGVRLLVLAGPVICSVNMLLVEHSHVR